MEEPPLFDLQSHSTCSDGTLEPEEVVARAAAAGVRLLALSDHDTVEGCDAAADAAERHGIDLVSATEISALDDGGQDLHILGYCIETHNRRLLEVLARCRGDREMRAEAMSEALEELGIAIDHELLSRLRDAGRPIGRPHLAAAAVRHPANAERLREENCAEDAAFLAAYLIPGRPAFRARRAPTIAGAIALIHGAGGVAVWAHPFWDIAADDQVLAALDRFRAAGLDGVEAFYITHTAEQTRLLHTRAMELGMLSTGSGDFHGPHHARFSRFRAFRLYGLEPELGPIAATR